MRIFSCLSHNRKKFFLYLLVALAPIVSGFLVVELERRFGDSGYDFSWWLTDYNIHITVLLTTLFISGLFFGNRPLQIRRIIFKATGVFLWFSLISYPRLGMPGSSGDINFTVLVLLSTLSIYPLRLWLLGNRISSVCVFAEIMLGCIMLYGNLLRQGSWGVTFIGGWIT